MTAIISACFTKMQTTGKICKQTNAYSSRKRDFVTLIVVVNILPPSRTLFGFIKTSSGVGWEVSYFPFCYFLVWVWGLLQMEECLHAKKGAERIENVSFYFPECGFLFAEVALYVRYFSSSSFSSHPLQTHIKQISNRHKLKSSVKTTFEPPDLKDKTLPDVSG